MRDKGSCGIFFMKLQSSLKPYTQVAGEEGAGCDYCFPQLNDQWKNLLGWPKIVFPFLSAT